MRKQIRFNDVQLRELELVKAKTRVKNDSEAIHLSIQYAIKYFELVTRGLETNEFELCLLRRNKKYKKKDNPDFTKF